MRISDAKITRFSGIANSFLIPAILFSLTFLFIKNGIETKILYFKLQPYFSLDANYLEFLKEFRLGYISLFSEFILHLTNHSFWGALWMTTILILLTLIYRRIFKDVLQSGFKGLEYVPLFFILISLARYSNIGNTISFFFVSGLLALPLTLIKSSRFIVRLLYTIIAVLTGILILGISTGVILCTIILFTQFLSTSLPRKLIVLGVTITLLAAGIFLLGLSRFKAELDIISADNQRLLAPMYWKILLVFPLAFLLYFLGKLLHKKWHRAHHLLHTFTPLLMLLVFLGLRISEFPNKDKYIAEIEYYSHSENWDKVLSFKNKVALNDRIPRFLLNSALYHKESMADDLFSVPQHWGEFTLFLIFESNSRSAIHSSDQYYDMGYIEAARYWAFEAQTFDPYAPRILKRLADCYLLLAEWTLADKYLNLLKETREHKEWAVIMQNALQNQEFTTIKKEYRDKYVCSSKGLEYVATRDPEPDLVVLLRNDPKNKMAFEYLMALYLMKNQLGKFYNYIDNLNNLNYRSIPDTYQEALVIYYLKNRLSVEEFPIPLDRDIQQQFMNYNKTIAENDRNLQKAKGDLRRHFQDTYWYFINFESPLVTNLKLKKN